MSQFDPTSEPSSPEEVIEQAGLVPASSLLPDSKLSAAEEWSLGLDRVRRTYKGMPIQLPSEIGWQHPEHDCRPDSFYVRGSRGTIGWVPWIGAAVVWPWEAAWVQDLRRKTIPPRLKKKAKEGA